MAERLRKLPPYLFAEIDKKKREARARGADLIDMGIGDPDLPTPPHIIQALTLVGYKEGTAHMPLAWVNPGDVVLVPDPGYPVYAAGTWFAGGEVHFMPLRRQNGFMPDLDAIPADVARRAKLMYLNYPNNS